MQRFVRRSRFLAYPVALALTWTGLLAPHAEAGVIGTDRLLMMEQAAEERARIVAWIEREDVQRNLLDYGLSPEQARERAAALTEAEARELAQHIERLPAGGDTLTLLLAVIILILLLR